jgi:hypothetical protein
MNKKINNLCGLLQMLFSIIANGRKLSHLQFWLHMLHPIYRCGQVLRIRHVQV